MSEMVERVARAIYAVDGGKGWHLHAKFYMDAARAAVAAMREPTEAMMDEGSANNFGKPSYVAYQAMIDAALSE